MKFKPIAVTGVFVSGIAFGCMMADLPGNADDGSGGAAQLAAAQDPQKPEPRFARLRTPNGTVENRRNWSFEFIALRNTAWNCAARRSSACCCSCNRLRTSSNR